IKSQQLKQNRWKTIKYIRIRINILPSQNMDKYFVPLGCLKLDNNGGCGSHFNWTVFFFLFLFSITYFFSSVKHLKHTAM
ncbi:hypothetical protein OFM39_35275, partial [Escherichia coli]|nr:hypothetical protein [Escherichia coli]